MEYKTGDVVKISEKEMAAIETHTKEKERLDIMLSVIMDRYHASEKRFWDTVRGLYPELKGFDLYGNWGKKEITLRGLKKEVIDETEKS